MPHGNHIWSVSVSATDKLEPPRVRAAAICRKARPAMELPPNRHSSVRPEPECAAGRRVSA
jgi:hypothetical protein